VLKAFLGNPVSGGGPEDLRVVKDWEAFVGRHTDTFLYDAATRMLGLHARSDDRSPIHSGNEVIDEAAEARVVQRLKAKLQAGPAQEAVDQNFFQRQSVYFLHIGFRWMHILIFVISILKKNVFEVYSSETASNPNIRR